MTEKTETGAEPLMLGADELEKLLLSCMWDILSHMRSVAMKTMTGDEAADAALAAMKSDPHGKDAVVLGETTDAAHGQIGLRTTIGGIRIVDMPLGNLVPRIC